MFDNIDTCRDGPKYHFTLTELRHPRPNDITYDAINGIQRIWYNSRILDWNKSNYWFGYV